MCLVLGFKNLNHWTIRRSFKALEALWVAFRKQVGDTPRSPTWICSSPGLSRDASLLSPQAKSSPWRVCACHQYAYAHHTNKDLMLVHFLFTRRRESLELTANRNYSSVPVQGIFSCNSVL